MLLYEYLYNFIMNHYTNFISSDTGAYIQEIETTQSSYKKIGARFINLKCNCKDIFYEFMFKKAV